MMISTRARLSASRSSAKCASGVTAAGSTAEHADGGVAARSRAACHGPWLVCSGWLVGRWIDQAQRRTALEAQDMPAPKPDDEDRSPGEMRPAVGGLGEGDGDRRRRRVAPAVEVDDGALGGDARAGCSAASMIRTFAWWGTKRSMSAAPTPARSSAAARGVGTTMRTARRNTSPPSMRDAALAGRDLEDRSRGSRRCRRPSRAGRRGPVSSDDRAGAVAEQHGGRRGRRGSTIDVMRSDADDDDRARVRWRAGRRRRRARRRTRRRRRPGRRSRSADADGVAHRRRRCGGSAWSGVQVASDEEPDLVGRASGGLQRLGDRLGRERRRWSRPGRPTGARRCRTGCGSTRRSCRTSPRGRRW